jgi:NADH dehydrogenase FAD-containing subunit
VIAVLARKPYPGGLMRNVVQCLYDYGIPLLLQHTVVEILGKDRVRGVRVARTDENSLPIPGTEELYECDTLILSVGLIPENELSLSAGVEMDRRTGGPIVNESRETSVPGIFACGNVVHVHDLVDFVVKESEIAGKGAARFVQHPVEKNATSLAFLPGTGLKYVVPQRVNPAKVNERLDLFLRVNRVYGPSCIEVREGGKVLKKAKRPRMNPGEMERVRIDRNAVETIKGSDLTVEVVEVEG